MGIYDNSPRFLDKVDLLSKLKNKNIEIKTEYDEFLLGNMIDYISYSTIGKGLKPTGLVNESGIFIQSVTPKELMNFHRLNMDISSLLLKYLLFVEQSLNSTLSNIISKNFGTDTSMELEDLNNPMDFLCVNNYRNNPDTINVLTKIKYHINNPVKFTSLEYYIKNKNYIPPWVVLNSIYLSDSINLYKIMKSEQKIEVVDTLLKIETENPENTIHLRKDLFGSYFNIIKIYRNKLAHPNILLKHKLPKELIFNQIGKYSNYTLVYNRNSDTKYRTSIIFSLILSILPLINLLDVSLSLHLDIQLFLKKYEDFKFFEKDIFDLLNVPKDLEERIFKFVLYKYKIPMV